MAVKDVLPINIYPHAFSLQRETEGNNQLYIGQELLALLPGENGLVTLQVVSLEQNIDENYYTYSGIVKDQTNSSFVITKHDEKIDGQIVIQNQLYIISYILDNDNPVYTLTWIDRGLIDGRHFSNDTSVSDDVFRGAIKSMTNNKSGGGSGVVRILFMYGSDVSTPIWLTSQIVAKMNTVLSNSGINNYTVSVADIDVLNTDFGMECRFDIEILMDNELSPFTDLHTKIANSYADMVAVVAKGNVSFPCDGYGFNGRIGGVAKLYNQFGGNSDNRFTNFSDNYALGDLTAIHEIGHTFGGLHEYQDGGANDPYPWSNNQAIVSGDETEQTIIGGLGAPHTCDFIPPVNGVPQEDCVRVEYFSHTATKKEFTDESPIGTSTRDNAEYFKTITLSDISIYRANPPAPTIAPVLTNTNLNCYGQNDLSWNTVNSANSYQVFRADNVSFNNPVRVYNGFNNYLFTNYALTVYYKVKACNEGGCSGYSNSETAQYINGCQ